MLNILLPILTFIFTFSIIWVIKTTFMFFSALLSTPPKPFEISKLEVLIHGLLISYIITFSIYI